MKDFRFPILDFGLDRGGPHISPHGVPPLGGAALTDPTRMDSPTPLRLKPTKYTKHTKRETVEAEETFTLQMKLCSSVNPFFFVSFVIPTPGRAALPRRSDIHAVRQHSPTKNVSIREIRSLKNFP